MYTGKSRAEKKWKRILLVCSGPSSMVKSTLFRLKEENPGCVITALVSADGKEDVLACGPCRVFVSHKTGRFSLFKTGIKKIKKIRSESFCAVTLLYNNPAGRECMNLDILGFFTGARVWIADSEKRLYPASGVRWTLFILPLRFFEFSVNLSLLSLTAPLILILLLISKLFGIKSLSVEKLMRYGG